MESIVIRALEYDLLYNENNSSYERDKIREFLHLFRFSNNDTNNKEKE